MASLLAGSRAVSCLALTKVETSAVPFHCTTESALKLLPCTVISVSPAPTRADAGASAVISAVGAMAPMVPADAIGALPTGVRKGGVGADIGAGAKEVLAPPPPPPLPPPQAVNASTAAAIANCWNTQAPDGQGAVLLTGIAFHMRLAPRLCSSTAIAWHWQFSAAEGSAGAGGLAK